MDYLLIRGSDQVKYGTLKKGLASQVSLENDQYPKTIVAAVNALKNHKFEMKYYDHQKRNRDCSQPESNEKLLIQVLHRKPEIILSDTATANPDTLVPIVI